MISSEDEEWYNHSVFIKIRKNMGISLGNTMFLKSLDSGPKQVFIFRNPKVPCKIPICASSQEASIWMAGDFVGPSKKLDLSNSGTWDHQVGWLVMGFHHGMTTDQTYISYIISLNNSMPPMMKHPPLYGPYTECGNFPSKNPWCFVELGGAKCMNGGWDECV